jgi:hypothetical protein
MELSRTRPRYLLHAVFMVEIPSETVALNTVGQASRPPTAE